MFSYVLIRLSLLLNRDWSISLLFIYFCVPGPLNVTGRSIRRLTTDVYAQVTYLRFENVLQMFLRSIS